jgi:CRP-like cAMP-binding protein
LVLACAAGAVRLGRGRASQEVVGQIRSGIVPVLAPTLSATTIQDGLAVLFSRPRRPLIPVPSLAVTRLTENHDEATTAQVEIRAIPLGTELFHQGENADALYVVTSGVIDVYRSQDNRKEPLAKLRKGETLGSVAALDHAPRRSTAVAARDSTVVAVPAAAMQMALNAADPTIRALLQSLRDAHDGHVPKSRHISDAVTEMREQVAATLEYLRSPSAPTDLTAAAAAGAARLQQLTDELVALIHRYPELDRRSRVMPEAPDLRPGKLPG